MTKLRKTVAAALTVAVLAGSGLSVTSTANAAPMIRAAAIETSANVVEVGYRHHNRRHGWRRHGWRHHGGYYHGRHCFWKKRKFWNEYYGEYVYKRFRVCR